MALQRKSTPQKDTKTLLIYCGVACVNAPKQAMANISISDKMQAITPGRSTLMGRL